MSRTFIVTGTDTDIGKTVFAAGLTRALGATYWKPVQAGLDDGSDRERVAALAGSLPAFDALLAPPRCRAGRGHDRSGRARFA